MSVRAHITLEKEEMGQMREAHCYSHVSSHVSSDINSNTVQTVFCLKKHIVENPLLIDIQQCIAVWILNAVSMCILKSVLQLGQELM